MTCTLITGLLLILLVGKGKCDAAADAQAKLYSVIHDLALPPAKPNEEVTERFIMLEPGEVLDYYDYVPLTSTTKTFLNPSHLPPDEAAFRLSDTLPSLQPVGGGMTGNSLSNIYSNILYTINTASMEDDPFENDAYKSALKYLQETVSDPSNAAAPNVSRSELYQRYKRHYYDTKMQVSKWITGNKSIATELDYENWYQESYPTLEALASSAHSQWLVEGLKGEVEDRLSIVDIKSVRMEVEDAKHTLQNAAKASLDGGTNYYPVEFVPSNWYEYLLAEPNMLTKDQIQAKIADLESRKLQLSSMMMSPVYNTTNLDKMRSQLKKHGHTEMNNLNDTINKLACMEYACHCYKANSQSNDCVLNSCKNFNVTASKACNDVKGVLENCGNATSALVQEWIESNSSMNQLSAYSNTKSMQSVLNNLDKQIKDLQDQLTSGNGASILPPIAAAANGTGAMTQEELDQNWMAFGFDSTTATSSTTTSSTSYKTATHFSAGGLFWSVSGSASYSQSSQNFAKKMSSADVSVSAKLLRVTFSRNWFQPSVFSIGGLSMQNGVNQVSPGPMTNEVDYVTKASSFLLPEYTTGFLLAKDVSMKFTGVDSSVTSHALHQSASASLSGSYGCFSASASFSYGHSSSSMKVSSLSDGMQIDIPGAQIIGYYTSVLPKFPA